VLSSNLFCAALSQDRKGRLVAAGGFPSLTHAAPTETYRFDPRVLSLNLSADPPVTGTPWSIPFHMSIGRYYPTLISLDRRSFASSCSTYTVPGGAQIGLGGPPHISNEGNELWQILDPWVGPEVDPVPVNPWLHTLVAPTATHTPTGVTEPYSLPLPAAQPLLDSYPRAFQLADPTVGPPLNGQIFIAFDVDTASPPANNPGKSWVMRLPPANVSNCWELVHGPDSFSSPLADVRERYYAPAVILHTLTLQNRVLAFGGSQPQASPLPPLPWIVHGRVQEFEPGSDPQHGNWRDKIDLNHARLFSNAIVLPTGYILVLGGSSVDTHNGGIFVSGLWVLIPELYHPADLPTQAGSTIDMAPSQVPRLYHSVAALLLDGSVLIAGGHERAWSPPPSGRTGEVYSPPYFFNGQRPVIDSPPGTIAFGGAPFPLDVATFHDHVHSVVLLRPAAVTHHFDFDQRYIELEFTVTNISQDVTSLNVTPPDESLGPPGYYTLWVVESKTSGAPTYTELLPSQGKLVRLN
jgi:hypothetical protein